MSTNFDDIHRMHQHFHLDIAERPSFMNASNQLFREGFLREEILEFEVACKERDLGEAADALIDLVVVAMGTAVMMGFPWQVLWDDVLRANLDKRRVRSTRSHGEYDLAKPEGWVPPRSAEIVDEWGAGVPFPVYSTEPTKVYLCGSTKFKDDFVYWNRELTLQGKIVLTVGFFGHADDEMPSATTKAALDQLHLHKIDLADEVFIVNPGGYIGESTRREIDYAKSRGKHIWFLEPDIA